MMKKRIKCFVAKFVDAVSFIFVGIWRYIPRVVNVNTISLLIAAIAAYLSYRTLDESIIQRETMYRPELYVGETKFYADLTDTAVIKYYRIEKDSIVWKEPVRVPWMRINNVGMGSALHVEGTVNLGPEVMSKAMKAMKIKRKSIDEIYDTYVHGEDTLKLLGAGGFRWHEDYTMPLYQTQVECIKDLPENDFYNMIKTALWLNGILHSRFQGFIIPVELKYKDINDRHYTKKTWMQVQCYTNEDRTGIDCRICSGIVQRKFMNEYDRWLNGENVDLYD